MTSGRRRAGDGGELALAPRRLVEDADLQFAFRDDHGLEADAVSVDAIRHLQEDVFKVITAASESTSKAHLVVQDVGLEFSRIRESISSLSLEGHRAAAASSSHAIRSGDVASRSDAIAASLDVAADGMSEVGEAAARTSALLTDLQSFTSEIGGIVEAIASVASQTRMLALNATIEAARAGPAGRGFSVVAAEIKTLSDETRTATEGISRRVEGLAASAHASLGAIRDILQTVERVEEPFLTVRSGMAEQLQAVTELADEAASTSSFIERVARAFDTIDQAADKATISLSVSNREAAEAVQTAEELGTRFFVAFRESAMGNRRTKRRFPTMQAVTLHLPDGPLTLSSIDISLDGIRILIPADFARKVPDELRLTIDGVGMLEARIVGRERRALRASFLPSAPASQDGLDQLISRLDAHYGGLVTMMRDTASIVSGAFVQGIRSGRISEQALFDHDYVAIPGTDPQQYTTTGLAFFEEILPAILDLVPSMDPKIEFCCAIDINGWLPVHQKRHSQPQRPGDRAWNIANCRNRRIYGSNVGAFAARAMRPYILQASPRDMGGSEPALIATIDVPLQLLGRNWGGLRLGYRL